MRKDNLIAIIGDIHSNYEAFKVVIEDIKKRNISTIFSLGDTVGYNADPELCIELLLENNITSLRGNHDRYAAGTSEVKKNIKKATRDAIEYTKARLNKYHRMLLNSFPDDLNVDNLFLLVHGSPMDRDEYILTSESVVNNLKYMQEAYPGINVCFFGHSHFPMVAGNGKILRKFTENTVIKLNPDKLYLINPGSVGQPRDKCAKASYIVFDPQTLTVEYIRLEYDIKTTQQKILKAGLDESLARRLEKGI